MTSKSIRVLAAICLLVSCRPQDDASSEVIVVEPTPKPVVVLETNRGSIRMELEPDLAPETVTNFLLHVRSGFYDDLIFYRVRAGFMIQTGQLTSSMQKRTSPSWPIANEAENGLKNVRGSIAMARAGAPHSATSEFFINLVDNVKLDFTEPTGLGWGYAVFGKVIEGMDVVDAIAATPVRPQRAHGQYFEAVPEDPIVVNRAFIEESQ